MFVCLLHESSHANKWFAHTPAVITSTQRAETAEHSATLRAWCVSWASVWQRVWQKNTLRISTRQSSRSARDALKPSNVTTEREEATCVNMGHKRVDQNYVADLCNSQSKNCGFVRLFVVFGFFLPFSNLIVGHKRNQSHHGQNESNIAHVWVMWLFFGECKSLFHFEQLWLTQ